MAEARGYKISIPSTSISKMTPVGFEPTPFLNGALSHRLRPLGQSVVVVDVQTAALQEPLLCRDSRRKKLDQLILAAAC